MPRVAVAGIGHELCGDDAAGPVLARTLKQTYNHQGDGHVLVIDAGPAPENCCSQLRRFDPDLVLLVDTAQLGSAPGTIRWLTWQDTLGLSASTHTLPLHLLATYLTGELGCQVALLGIQPANLSVGARLSPEVKRAVITIAKSLASALSMENREASAGRPWAYS
ncbi:MAG: hydrogenase maturation peptidase HycI [Anaerolineae bacterium]